MHIVGGGACPDEHQRHVHSNGASIVTCNMPIFIQEQLEDDVAIPKATIDILKDQVFCFEFVTSHEPYEHEQH